MTIVSSPLCHCPWHCDKSSSSSPGRVPGRTGPVAWEAPGISQRSLWASRCPCTWPVISVNSGGGEYLGLTVWRRFSRVCSSCSWEPSDPPPAPRWSCCRWTDPHTARPTPEREIDGTFRPRLRTLSEISPPITPDRGLFWKNYLPKNYSEK